jgi:hypothetical protein
MGHADSDWLTTGGRRRGGHYGTCICVAIDHAWPRPDEQDGGSTGTLRAPHVRMRSRDSPQPDKGPGTRGRRTRGTGAGDAGRTNSALTRSAQVASCSTATARNMLAAPSRTVRPSATRGGADLEGGRPGRARARAGPEAWRPGRARAGLGRDRRGRGPGAGGPGRGLVLVLVLVLSEVKPVTVRNGPGGRWPRWLRAPSRLRLCRRRPGPGLRSA